ncbi:Glycosyltransferase [Vibrio cholerae]|nr:putative glycosyltransferase [Vibrio cholerae]GHX42264.1 Glycosyltransferase [Vibrio cholerae]
MDNIKEPPLVTIAVPSYQHEKFIQDSILSIINQDYFNIELIIIDDGSSDSSVNKIEELIETCEKRFVRFEFRHRPNRGLCATLNEALEWARGDFFSPIASDDVLKEKKISFLVGMHQEVEAAVIFGSAEVIDENNKIKKEIINQKEHFFNDLIQFKNMPLAPGSLMRTNKIRSVGGFDESIKLEDLYMWLKLAQANEKLISYPEIVVSYRDHDNNTVKNHKSMHNYRCEVVSLFNQHELFNEAMKKSSIIAARATSSSEIIYPLKQLFYYGKINLEVFFIVLKIFTPRIIFNIVNKL